MYQSKKELRKELEEVKERLRRETKYSGSCADRNVELAKANARLKKKINELNEAFIAMRDGAWEAEQELFARDYEPDSLDP